MISSAVLQIIAMICMLLDHIGFFLLDDFWVFRAIGRLAMPIFVFSLAEGFIHTSSKTRYFFRLLILAILSEVPLFLLSSSMGRADTYAHNILINFLLAFVALLCVSKNKYLIILTPILAGLGEYFRIDYGWLVVPMTLLFYYALKHQRQKMITYYLSIFAILALASSLKTIQNNWPVQLFGMLASVPIALYDGTKGKRLPKYISYAFYPCHLMILFVIRVLFFR